MKAQASEERTAQGWREFIRVTREDLSFIDIPYEWWLVNINGAGFLLKPGPEATQADIDCAERKLRSDRDVVTLQIERTK